MKRHKLIQRLTAALVAGAMALSLSAPALAEAPQRRSGPRRARGHSVHRREQHRGHHCL